MCVSLLFLAGSVYYRAFTAVYYRAFTAVYYRVFFSCLLLDLSSPGENFLIILQIPAQKSGCIQLIRTA